jgi:hypothetical protein
MKIEITSMLMKDVDKLGNSLKGDWCVKRRVHTDGTSRVWLVKNEIVLRVEDVKNVI